LLHGYQHFGGACCHQLEASLKNGLDFLLFELHKNKGRKFHIKQHRVTAQKSTVSTLSLHLTKPNIMKMHGYGE
jgi:hypothetical protein